MKENQDETYLKMSLKNPFEQELEFQTRSIEKRSKIAIKYINDSLIAFSGRKKTKSFLKRRR